MKKKKMTLFALRALVTSTFAAALVSPCVHNATAQEVTLKAVTAWGRNLSQSDMYMEWIKRVNERGKGKVRINYVGGPEVFPTFEQLEPLKRGVIATIHTSSGYVGGALPELTATWFGFGADPAQMRASGLVEALDKATREKAGIVTLGFPSQMRFYLYLKKPIKGADLRGLKIRTVPVYDPVLKGLGAVTVTVPPTEVLTALDTGVVDGFAWPAVSMIGPGFARAIKYRVTPFWWVGTDVALMNAKIYDSLKADVKTLLVETMIEIEKETSKYFLAKENEEDAAMEKIGVEKIEISPAELKKVHQLHWERGTESLLLKPAPKYGPELKKVLAKFAPQ